MPNSNVVPLGVNAQQMLKIVRETAANKAQENWKLYVVKVEKEP